MTTFNNGTSPRLKFAPETVYGAVYLHINLNDGKLVVDRQTPGRRFIWLIPKGMEDQMNYENVERIKQYQIYVDEMNTIDSSIDEFTTCYNLLMDEMIFSPGNSIACKNIGNGSYASLPVEVWWHYVRSEKKWYSWNSGSPLSQDECPGYWSIPAQLKGKEAFFSVVSIREKGPVVDGIQTYNNYESYVFKALDSCERVYVDVRDDIFDYENYQTPSTEDYTEEGFVTLERVEGEPGMFRGLVNLSVHNDWKVSGMMLFDRFRSSQDDKYPCVHYVTGEFLQSAFDSRGFQKKQVFSGRNAAESRIGVYPYLEVPVEVTLDLRESSLQLYLDPENFPYYPDNDTNIIWLVGSLQNWTISDKNLDYSWALGRNEAGQFERTFLLPEGETSFRFYRKMGQWGPTYSVGALWEDFSDIEVAPNSLSTAIAQGQGNWLVNLDEPTYVKMIVDLKEGTLQLKVMDGIDTNEPVPTAPVFSEKAKVNGSVESAEPLRFDDDTQTYSMRIMVPAGEQTMSFVGAKSTASGIKVKSLDDNLLMGANYDGRPVLENGEMTERRIVYGSEDSWSTADDWEGGYVDITLDLNNASAIFKPAKIEKPYPEKMKVLGSGINYELTTESEGVYTGSVQYTKNPGKLRLKSASESTVSFGAAMAWDTSVRPDGQYHYLCRSGNSWNVPSEYTEGTLYFLVNLNEGVMAVSDHKLEGIGDVNGDLTDEGEVRYYDLQGRRVAAPGRDGIYIRVSAKGATKQIGADN